MALADIRGASPVPFSDETATVNRGGQQIRYSHASLRVWTEAERKAAGFATIAPEPAAPEGKVETGRSLQMVDGQPTWVITWGDAPTVRRLIPKPVAHTRLVEIGKLGAVWTVLASNPDWLGRWLMPGHPNVYADDADFLAALAAGGCTADEIATVTAP